MRLASRLEDKRLAAHEHMRRELIRKRIRTMPVGTDDDERTNVAAAEPRRRAALVEHLTDALIAHTDTSRYAPVAGVAGGH